MIVAAPPPEQPTSRVLVDLHPGDTIDFVGAQIISVQVVAKSGRAARLCIVAPRDVKIERSGARASDTSMAGFPSDSRG